MQPVRPIFRTSALTFYQKAQNQYALPSVFPIRLLLCVWIVLCLCIGAGYITLSITIPTSIDATGVVTTMNSSAMGQAHMILLVEAKQTLPLKQHASFQIEAWTATAHFVSRVHHPNTQNSESGTIINHVPQPFIPTSALIAFIPANVSTHLNIGQRLDARILIGSTTLLTLLLGSGSEGGW